MEKVTFMFLSEYSLQQFISRTTGVPLKPDIDNLTVVCNCKNNECSQGIIEEAQIGYGAMVIREINI
jgi:hypothetical protein